MKNGTYRITKEGKLGSKRCEITKDKKRANVILERYNKSKSDATYIYLPTLITAITNADKEIKEEILLGLGEVKTQVKTSPEEDNKKVMFKMLFDNCIIRFRKEKGGEYVYIKKDMLLEDLTFIYTATKQLLETNPTLTPEEISNIIEIEKTTNEDNEETPIEEPIKEEIKKTKKPTTTLSKKVTNKKE